MCEGVWEEDSGVSVLPITHTQTQRWGIAVKFLWNILKRRNINKNTHKVTHTHGYTHMVTHTWLHTWLHTHGSTHQSYINSSYIHTSPCLHTHHACTHTSYMHTHHTCTHTSYMHTHHTCTHTSYMHTHIRYVCTHIPNPFFSHIPPKIGSRSYLAKREMSFLVNYPFAYTLPGSWHPLRRASTQ